MRIMVRSALDVALWFNDRAFGEGEYLQPQKLHRLMYLSFAYFTVAYPHQKLMPASFVIDEFGPVEPTVFHALAYGVPNNLESHTIPTTVIEFLENIWRRFGKDKTEKLSNLVATHDLVADAIAKGTGTEITLEQMLAYYGAELAAKQGAPAAGAMSKPRILRSADGKAVTVSAWMPKKQ